MKKEDRNLIFLWKQVGFTPLQSLRMAALKYPKLELNGWTYAGRLDPLASGVLPIVDGKDLELKKEVIGFSKTYVSKVLFGVGTDSLDVLGKVLEFGDFVMDREKVEQKILELVGKREYLVPEYSSVSVGSGNSVRQKMLGKEVSRVVREMEVLNTKVLGFSEVNVLEVREVLRRVYETLEGDFREEVVLGSWGEISDDVVFQAVEFELEVKSGVYVRSLVEDLGKKLSIPACLFELTRVRVGEVGREGCMVV